MPDPIGAIRRVAVAFDELALASDPEARRGFGIAGWRNATGPPRLGSSCVLDAAAARPGDATSPRHRLRVVGEVVLGVLGGVVLGVVVVAAVVLGTVPAGAVVVGTATGAVFGAGPDADVVDVPGARVADGIDRSAPATTIPTDVLAPCRDRLPNKLASGCRATASTPVIAPTAIPKASTAATATRRQRIGWGRALLAPSSFAPACSPARRRSERRATVWADANE
jgi:hypothetical protein